MCTYKYLITKNVIVIIFKKKLVVRTGGVGNHTTKRMKENKNNLIILAYNNYGFKQLCQNPFCKNAYVFIYVRLIRSFREIMTFST